MVLIMKKVNKNNGIIDTATVGGRIKKLRIDAGLTQEELGYALNMEGKSVIYGYESNRRRPDWDVLLDLAKILCTTPEYIITGVSQDGEDPYISAVVALMKTMETDKEKKIALEHVKLVMKMYE